MLKAKEIRQASKRYEEILGKTLEGQDTLSIFQGRLRSRVELLMKAVHRFPADDQQDGNEVQVRGWYSELKKEVMKELGISKIEIEAEDDYERVHNHLVATLVKNIASELPAEGRSAALFELIGILNAPNKADYEEGCEEIRKENDELKEKFGIDGLNPQEFDWERGDLPAQSGFLAFRTRVVAVCFPDLDLAHALHQLNLELMDSPGATTADLEKALQLFLDESRCQAEFWDVYLPDYVSNPIFISMIREISRDPQAIRRFEAIGLDIAGVKQLNEDCDWGIDI